MNHCENVSEQFILVHQYIIWYDLWEAHIYFDILWNKNNRV